MGYTPEERAATDPDPDSTPPPEESTDAPEDESVDGRSIQIPRRPVLAAVNVGIATSSAGCSFILGDDGSDPLEEPTSPTATDYGYGGTTSGTAVGDDGATDSGDGTDQPSTDGAGGSTATDTPAGTTGRTSAATTPVDEYGLQGYGQYDYGG